MLLLPYILGMREEIEKAYKKIGINLKTNIILKEFLDLVENDKEILRKQFEIFHMDFLLGLSNIKETDKKSFERYVENINQTKGELNFWGEKFEIFMHSKLLKENLEIIKNLRRGIDGIETDLVFDFNNSSLGIELTTLKFLNPPKTKDIILSKISNKILEKNKKPYSNDKTALIIDITNIVAYEKVFNLNLNEILKKHFNGFEYLNKKINFGMVILCNSVFRENTDGTLKHRLDPRIGLISETKKMNSDLRSFLNILFNYFKSDNDYDLKFHHLNI